MNQNIILALVVVFAIVGVSTLAVSSTMMSAPTTTEVEYVTVDANAGSIDYDTGFVDITLNVKSISGTSVTDLRITAQPHESAKDIKTEVLTRQSDRLNTESGAVVALPSKNIIIIKDTTANDIPNNIRAGLTVNLTAKTSD